MRAEAKRRDSLSPWFVRYLEVRCMSVAREMLTRKWVALHAPWLLEVPEKPRS